MCNRGNIPHRNRLEFLAPPFVSRQKVEEKCALSQETIAYFATPAPNYSLQSIARHNGASCQIELLNDERIATQQAMP
jgi:hypothetical protein